MGPAAAGWTWEAGSGSLKESLVCSGNSVAGDCTAPVGAGLSWDLYRADAGVNAVVANRVPAGLGAAWPLVRYGAWLGGVSGGGLAVSAKPA